MSGPLKFTAKDAASLTTALQMLTEMTEATGCVLGGGFPTELNLPDTGEAEGSFRITWRADDGYVVDDRVGD